MRLRFHAKTFALLGRQLVASKRALQTLDRIERDRNLTFPPSVREWYGLKDAVQILKDHSNVDHLTPITRLGEAADPVAEGKLIFKTENQGNCDWAVEVDGSDDPPVVVSDVDSPRYQKWLWCADSFSEYVYCCVWDYTYVYHTEGRLLWARCALGPTRPSPLAEVVRRGAAHRRLPMPAGVQVQRPRPRHPYLGLSSAGRLVAGVAHRGVVA